MGNAVKKRKFKVYFSDYFDVTPQAISDYGAFNISLINDLPLFIDPFLLFNSENEEYQRLHDEIIKYVRFLKDHSNTELPKGLLKSWFEFSEIKENWLGYSKSGNSGRGLGPEFARALKVNLTTVFRNFGEESGTGSHLEKLTLVKNGVGRDQISDLTCNLICGFLAEYTETFALKNIAKEKLAKFAVPKVSFNYKTQSWSSKQFWLPKHGNQFVLLTPTEILTKDEAWISHKGFVEDFSAILGSVENTQLRSQIDNYFHASLPLNPDKEGKEKAIEMVIAKYPLLLDHYIFLKEQDSNGAIKNSDEKVGEARTLFLDNLEKLIELLDSKTKFYETKINSLSEALARVDFLKHVIEKQDGYRLFYVKGKPIRKESDLQIMFKLTWYASAFDSNAEVNNGRGPADFIVSKGSADKTVVELKLAKNTHLEKNLLKQAEIYADASRATHPPVKVILFFTDEERAKVNLLLMKHSLNKRKEIVLIDATAGKASASKA
ncbi:hypothetical protein [Herbaspirillum frisingense]|uniref:hypothetical protein n=1 Tax=Herbaspirillum frisingense TaxID=92645 RepID=UPI001F2020F9|nr:hypothetical protein [Herbaspirillum frisingense]UIN19403.1 hypothetical protein LAZ82_12900 [Herbaspirillum frisingense]